MAKQTLARDNAMKAPASACGLVYDLDRGWLCYLNPGIGNIKHVGYSKVRKEARDIRKRARYLKDDELVAELNRLADHMDVVATQCQTNIKNKIVPKHMLQNLAPKGNA